MFWLLFHPSIRDVRTWSKLGEHGKDGKYQPDDSKHYIYDSKHCVCDSKTIFVDQMTLNSLFHGGIKGIIFIQGLGWVSSKWENIKRKVEPGVIVDILYTMNSIYKHIRV